MSLMKVMDILVRMGYEEVYLLGFDGLSGAYHYFYEDPAHYPEESQAWQEAVDAGIQAKFGGDAPTSEYTMDTGGNIFNKQTTGKTKYGKNGYEQALSAFAVFNGIRLVNLSPESTLNKFVYTRTIHEAIRALRSGAGAV